jgi:hypothetical protein
MTKPQQQEVARSGRGASDPGSAKSNVGGPSDESGPAGPVPEANQPGHHPDVDQDKPDGPPPVPKAARRKAAREEATGRFRFEFEPKVAPFSAAFGVTPWTSWLDLRAEQLEIRFGPWSLRTDRENVAGAEVTGPYSLLKVAGPAHLSFADRGVTFATSTERGVCISFREPVRALMPFGSLRHPAVTVTVRDPDRLVELLSV